ELIDQLERRRPPVGKQHLRPAVRIERGQAAVVRSLDRQYRDRAVLADDPHRPAATDRIQRMGSRAQSAQKVNSVTRGTWSDGFSQLRHGSSTLCPVAWPAIDGLAHI